MGSNKLTINNLNKIKGYNVDGRPLSSVKEYEDRYEIRGSAYGKMDLCIIIYRDMEHQYQAPFNPNVYKEYRVRLVKSKMGALPEVVREFRTSFDRLSDMIGWLSDVQTEMDWRHQDWRAWTVIA